VDRWCCSKEQARQGFFDGAVKGTRTGRHRGQAKTDDVCTSKRLPNSCKARRPPLAPPAQYVVASAKVPEYSLSSRSFTG
jgi:hypothetical protein